VAYGRASGYFMASDELAAMQTNIALNYNELFDGTQPYETC
jgi:hypothetical protein